MYTQQLEAGGAEVGTLQVDSNAQFAGDANVQGGLSIGQSLQTAGDLGIGGSTYVQGTLAVAGGIQGGVTVNGLSTPGAPTVTTTGTTGTTSYSYAVAAVSASGGTTVASSNGTIATGNASLTGSHYNVVSWTPVSGAVSYKVYRTASGGTPATTGLIGTTGATTLNDTGLAGDGATASSTNTSGQFTLNGPATFNENNLNNVNIVSDLSGGSRSGYAMTLSQANNASNNNSVGLLQLSNSDTASTAGLLSIGQVAGGTGIDFSASAGSSTGLLFGFNYNGTAIDLSNTSLSTSTAINVRTANLTSGNSIILGGSAGGALGAFTGNALLINPARSYNFASPINDTGNLLNINRSNTVNNASAVYTVSGAVATLQSNCTQTAGTCTDTSNILNLNQQYASASGAVLNIQNAGSGADILFNKNGHSVGLSVSGSLGAAYSLVLPTVAPGLSQCLQNDGSTIGQLTWGACSGGGGTGLTGVGTYSTTNTNASGATVSGSSIIFQSASTSAPGMVDTGAQTFAGVKTFNDAVATGNQTSNLMLDPGAELGGEGLAANAQWSVQTNAGAAHSGSKYYQGTGTGVANSLTQSNYIPVAGGQSYQLSYWIKKDSGTNGTATGAITYYTAGKAALFTATASSQCGLTYSTTWQLCSAHFYVQPTVGASYIRLNLQTLADSTTGNWYVDDIDFQRADSGLQVLSGPLVAYLPAPVITSFSQSTLGALSLGGTYYYQVLAYNSTTNSYSSAGPERSFTLTGLNNKITVNWSAVQGANGYLVERGTASGQEDHSWFVGSGTSYTDDGSGSANIGSGYVANYQNYSMYLQPSGDSYIGVNGGNFGIGTHAPQYGLDVQANGSTNSGKINAAVGYVINGTAGASVTCSGGQFLQDQVVQGGIVTGGTCATASGGSGGDNITVNGSAATDANFLDTTATATVAGTSWSLNAGATPNGISLSISAASASVAGIVTSGDQTFGGNKTFNGSLTVAAGQSLTLTGSGTRPSSPTKGMLYFDTTTNQLIQYNGSKWISDRSSNTYIVAATNSVNKDAADYVADGDTTAAGDGDQVQINQALTAAASTGGSVYLMEGTYTIDASISIPNNVTLTGSGAGTIITIPNSFNANINMVTNIDTSTGKNIAVQNLLIDGNKASQTSGNAYGIYFIGMGGGSATDGAKITNVTAKNMRSGSGIYLSGSINSTITTSTAVANGNNGIQTQGSAYITITGNITQGNANAGIWDLNSGYLTITGNITQGNTNFGIEMQNTINSTITGNIVQGNAGNGIDLFAANKNTISGNNLYDNTASSAMSSILVSGNDNLITDNNITDTAGVGYAIEIWSGALRNYLSNNRYSGTGTASISDAGTGTVYANQQDGSGNLVIKPTSNAGLSIQNAFNPSTGGTQTGTSLTVTNAPTSVANTAIGQKITVSDATALANTIQGFVVDTSGITNSSASVTTVLFKTKNSATAFVVQDGSSNAIFTVDTAAASINVGGYAKLKELAAAPAATTGFGTIYVSSSDHSLHFKNASGTDITLGAGGGGTHGKTVKMAPEFAGAIFSPDGTNNTGFMSANHDTANNHNYYSWTTDQTTAQDYDIVVRSQLPSDFGTSFTSGSWKVYTYVDSLTATAISFTLQDAGGTTCYTGTQSIKPSSAGAWQQITIADPGNGCSFAADDFVTIDLKLTAVSPNSTDQVRVGELQYQYTSTY